METALLPDAMILERHQEHADEMFDFLAQPRPTLTEGARRMRAGMGPVVSESGLDDLRRHQHPMSHLERAVGGAQPSSAAIAGK